MLPSEFSVVGEFPPVTYEEWRASAERELGGGELEQRLVARTYEGIAIQALYSGRDWDGADDPSGFPGRFPFTRGSWVLGHTLRGWDMRQEHAHPDPRAANAAIRADLDGGATSIALRLDRPARGGPASDAAPTAGHVSGGMQIDVLDDLEAALAGVELRETGVALDAGTGFLPAAALLIALWRRRGVSGAEARGAFNADPLAVLAAEGRLHVPLERALAEMAGLAAWTGANLPQVTAVRVSTAPYHDAGAGAAQELAFAMATGLEYLRAAEAAGLKVDEAARQFLFSFCVDGRFFEGLAKLRAARRLWARIMAVCSGEAAVQGLRMEVRPGWRVLTRRDPWVNLLRNTVGCCVGVLAGADVITSVPFDSLLGLPDEFSRRVARNTQLILREEAQLHRVIDPAGGSWFIEKLTDEIAARAWGLLQQIEARGGMARALLDGWVAARVAEISAVRARDIATRRQPITGVSEFPDLHETPVARRAPDAEVRRRAIARAPGRGDEQALGRRLRDVEALARVGRSVDGALIEALVSAAAQGAALGEMTAALAGEAQPAAMQPLAAGRDAQAFEELRDASDAYLARHLRRPRVFLAHVGPTREHVARATYARSFFEAGGFEVVDDGGGATAADTVAAFRTSAASVAAICAAEERYAAAVAEVASALKAAGARTVVLVGNPGEREEGYRAAGVDRFIGVGCDAVQTLRELLMQEGALA